MRLGREVANLISLNTYSPPGFQNKKTCFFHMAAVDDYNFEGAEAGAALEIPMEAGKIKKGGYMNIKVVIPQRGLTELPRT